MRDLKVVYLGFYTGDSVETIHRGAVHYHEDLLAAPAAGGVPAAHVAEYHFGYAFQHDVAALVAVGVVDLLEVVEVAHYDTERAFGGFKRAERSGEAVAVVQPGEGVVGGNVVQPVVGFVELVYEVMYLKNEQRAEPEQQYYIKGYVDGAHEVGLVKGEGSAERVEERVAEVVEHQRRAQERQRAKREEQRPALEHLFFAGEEQVVQHHRNGHHRVEEEAGVNSQKQCAKKRV